MDGQVPGVLHPRIAFGVHTAAGEPVSIDGRAGAGFRLADQDLAGYVVLDFAAFDDWYEEDERIAGHPRDPYHRVDVRQSAPLPDAVAIAGLVAFWDERVDVFLDGERRNRPAGAIAAALRDEFDV
jgi:hypothetical protein